MSIDPRVTEFRDAVIRVLRARPVDLDVSFEVPVLTLSTAWCEERANQLAVVLQGFLAPPSDGSAPLASCGHPRHPRGFGCTHEGCANDSRQFERGPIDESGGGEDPGI